MSIFQNYLKNLSRIKNIHMQHNKYITIFHFTLPHILLRINFKINFVKETFVHKHAEIENIFLSQSKH